MKFTSVRLEDQEYREYEANDASEADSSNAPLPFVGPIRDALRQHVSKPYAKRNSQIIDHKYLRSPIACKHHFHTCQRRRFLPVYMSEMIVGEMQP